MIGKSFTRYSVESYITGQGKKGYYLLVQDSQRRWYWAVAYGEKLDSRGIVELCGPCSSKGEAILAGEDWVEMDTRRSYELT